MKPLDGVILKLERAKEHIDNLQHEVRMFMIYPQPYNVVLENNPDGPGYIARVKILHAPPLRFGIIAGEVVHLLRSCLDMVAWELGQIGPNPPPDNDIRTSFPICGNEDNWNLRHTQEKIECMDPAAVDVIKRFQPFDTPDHPLALLQAIDNRDKHKAILVAGTVHISKITPLSGHFITSPRLGAFEDGDEICRVVTTSSMDPEEHFQTKMMCHIGFAKEGPGRGMPLGETCEGFYDFIRIRVVPSFERFFE